MGQKFVKSLKPWYAPHDSETEDESDEEKPVGLRTAEHDEFLDIMNEDERLRGCRVGDVIIPVGCCWTDRKTCTYYQCQEYNQLSSMTCPEGCTCCAWRRCKEVPGDPDRDYPHCCSKLKCEPPKFNTVSELDALGDLCDDPRNCL